MAGKYFEDRPKVAVIRLSGIITDSRRRNAICYARYAKVIEKAFEREDIVAVALAINSPGGSAGQSSLVAGLIRQIAEEKEIPVYSFIEDIAASGGYWLACAGDEIYAQAVSLVGSIGVISSGFGMDQFIERHGITRRLHTAGREKSMLDPFLPEKQEDIERLQIIQKDLHNVFIDWVRERRGHMLKATDRTIFEGRIWAAQAALELGLVDGISDIRSLMRQKFGDRVKLIDMPVENRFLPPPFPSAQVIDVSGIGDEMLEALEARALWGRYGL
ncbi:MAG: S49 family peptidase [Micavibrio aeruginosavorus]|uniref:S49 family peptidase n=1 Tax=Micavibrio aeruginosavorus TaxID=349221 RepID=A0A7T5R4Q6_9BACT|nr:MAG: S49 family peptidase [Micavibrio aeruginosavorus]